MDVGWTHVAALVAVPVVLVAGVPRRMLRSVMLTWVALPIVGYFAVIEWEMLTRPGANYPPGTALTGFMLLSPIIAPPWLILCLISFGLGLAIRSLLHRAMA